MSETASFIHAFNLTRTIGPASFQKLARHFNDDFSAAWAAGADEYIRAGMREKTAHAVCERKPSINPSDAWERLLEGGVTPLSFSDALYPPLLKETPYPPPLLYARGSLDPIRMPCVAVVGTRTPTAYGKQATQRVCTDLAGGGICIASGLALGIDGIAHTTAVEKKAPTIAVLGSGIDEASLYPASHRRLARAICGEGGLILSEFPLGTRAEKHHFPQRNRIIAGICKGTCVIEAKKKSGALITARYALDANRDVFALPGSIFSAFSEGPHALIKDGAAAITSGQDILDAYGMAQHKTRAHDGREITERGRAILELLDSPLSAEEICAALDIASSELNTELSLLELSDAVIDIGNKTYARA